MGQRTLIPKTRSKVTERGTTVAGAAKENEQWSFYRQKMELRSYHKKLRAGLVVWEDVPKEYRDLLIVYYNYTKEGIQL